MGKTTLARQLMQQFAAAQYLNWDVPADRAVLLRQSWSPRSTLLVLDEVHKMPNWKRCEDIALHYLRTKDGAEADFCIAGAAPRQLIECKLAEAAPHRALVRFAAQFAPAEAVQLVRDLRQEEQRGAVQIVRAAPWLARLAA